MDDLRLVAMSLVEDGCSDSEIADFLIEYQGANPIIAGKVAGDIYAGRQKDFRIKGVFLIFLSAVALFCTFGLCKFVNNLLSGLNSWSAHQIGGFVYFLQIILWVVAFIFFLRGCVALLFGGKGFQKQL